MKTILTLIGTLFVFSTINATDIDLQKGMVITHSVSFLSKTYLLNADMDLSKPILVIEGSNITIDFKQAILKGSNDQKNPDKFYGLAILIKKGSKNIILKNAMIHGFKVAVMADSVENLTIDQCNLSYQYRQYLKSNWQREDISDWMSFHHNEKDEWLRYGAGIYLKNCINPTISNNEVTGSQCALLMTNTRKATVYHNNFSFNSAIGIGLYRSSQNTIYNNKLDFNVRGYSHGKYKRGQDSAGFLVFEQSSDNIFAYNSATHSGDGFFLWAGQTTMDSGKGGSNDNFIYNNNFSYAPTNGIEVTFSRNLIMKNIIKDCDHGIWGGYSFDTDITDNTFANNRIGIAIEHGQNFNIALNSFENDLTGVKLWSREKQPEDWVYPTLKNTESRNYWIAANRFTATETAFNIMGTDTVVFSGNIKLMVNQPLILGERVENIDTSREASVFDMDYQKDERLKLIKVKELPTLSSPSGKKEIKMTVWGPYDFSYPYLHLKEIDQQGIYQFEVLGPAGKWKPEKMEGFELVAMGIDSFPSTLSVKADTVNPYKQIVLTRAGNAYTNQFGQLITDDRPFTYQAFVPQNNWDINWYQWDAAHDPEKDYETFKQIFNQVPVKSAKNKSIDFTWWGKIGNDLPADSFATVAETKLLLKAGTYEIGITADDLVKLTIDDKNIIDAWEAHYTALDENTYHSKSIYLEAGWHQFRIIHAEKKGLATLQFYLNPLWN